MLQSTREPGVSEHGGPGVEPNTASEEPVALFAPSDTDNDDDGGDDDADGLLVGAP